MSVSSLANNTFMMPANGYPDDQVIQIKFVEGKRIKFIRHADTLRYEVTNLMTDVIESRVQLNPSDVSIDQLCAAIPSCKARLTQSGEVMITLPNGYPLFEIHLGEAYPDLKEGHPDMYMMGVIVTLISCAAYALPFFASFPLAGFVQVVALGVLMAVGYGILNDQIACRQCIEYFTIGHTRYHKRLLKTDDPTLNGVVWGIHATWILGLIAGVVMAVAARIFKAAAISALTLTPYAVALVIISSILAHLFSKAEEAEYKKPERQTELETEFAKTLQPASKNYHPVDLSEIPAEKRAAYNGVGARNGLGYIVMPLGGLALTVGTIAARIFMLVF